MDILEMQVEIPESKNYSNDYCTNLDSKLIIEMK